MSKKKSFDTYYLLVSEGSAEYWLFAYLTGRKFKDLFGRSSIKFSNKVEIVEVGISQGRLSGVSDVKNFESKYDLIKEKYQGQRRFFLLDRDLDDSPEIERIIKENDDIVQFVEYNSEYLLLKLASKNPKNPSDFNNLGEFRDYCKPEFQKHFGKNASDFKDSDFDLIFESVTDEVIKNHFSELFSTLS